MSFVKRIMRSHPRDPILARWFGGGLNTASGVAVGPDTAMRETAVYSCVRVLAESVAQLPLFVYQRRADGGKDRAIWHPLYDVLHNHANSWQTSFEFRETLMAYAALRGNGIARIISAGGKGVAELVPLLPDRVEVFRAPDGGRAYRYTPERGGQLILRQDEVLHIPGLSLDGLSGVSPITYHRETVGASLAIKDYGARLFGNGAKPGGILKHPSHFKDKTTRDRVRDSWDAFTNGANAGKTAVLEDGMEWQQVGMTSEDAQYLETRKFNRTEIASIFRVPPHKIGDLEKATFSNIEQQSIEFVTDTLMPWLVRWEQAISRDLLSAEDRRRGYFAEFQVMGLLRGDAVARSNYYRARFQTGSISPNQIRALENENPEEGGDTAFVPLNMIPIAQAGKPQDTGGGSDEKP